MIVSKSKLELAKKIKSSGFDWPLFGRWATQDGDGVVFVSGGTFPPVRRGGEKSWEFGEPYSNALCLDVGKNWFQCILSREEYFHLYPAPDADGWIEWKGGDCPVDDCEIVQVKYRDDDGSGLDAIEACELRWEHDVEGYDIIAYRLHKPEQAKHELFESVTRSIPEPESKPNIEQLAADYSNRKECAYRKQQEADAAKADAEARLEELIAAGKAIGLVVSVADAETELVITDWRDLRVGDEIECIEYEDKYRFGRIEKIDPASTSQPILVKHANSSISWPTKWRFIRRP